MKFVKDVINQWIEYKLKKSGFATRTGSTRAANRVYPATVTNWENFEANAADTDDDDMEVTDMPLAYTLKNRKKWILKKTCVREFSSI